MKAVLRAEVHRTLAILGHLRNSIVFDMTDAHRDLVTLIQEAGVREGTRANPPSALVPLRYLGVSAQSAFNFGLALERKREPNDMPGKSLTLFLG